MTPVCQFDKEEAEAFSNAIADVLCWFHGFEAAYRMKESWDRPTSPLGIPELRDLKRKLDAAVCGGKK